MNRRDTGFLLVGLGFGLIFSVVAVLEILSTLDHHPFIIGIHWDSPILPVPPLVILIGLGLIRRKRSTA